MRYLIFLSCFLAVSSLMAKDFTMATVDMQKLFKEYPGTLPAQKKFEAYTKQRQAELKDSQNILLDLQKELTGKKKLTDSEKEDKEKAFQDETQNFQDEKTRIQNEVADKEQEMTQAIVGKIKDIVAKAAQKDGVDLVLDSADTLTVKSGLDLTSEVLTAFKNISSDSTDSDDSTDTTAK